VIGIGVLGRLLAGQARASLRSWPQAFKRTLAAGALAAVAWALFVVLGLPWLFAGAGPGTS
jgi:hypothetical protein